MDGSTTTPESVGDSESRVGKKGFWEQMMKHEALAQLSGLRTLGPASVKNMHDNPIYQNPRGFVHNAHGVRHCDLKRHAH